MKRNFTIQTQEDVSIFVTPAQRLWVERAADFCSSSEDVEDWSFLRDLSLEESGEQIESDKEEQEG